MRVINFDKGSKRRLRQIRWKYAEVVSLVLLLLVTVAITTLGALWLVAHDSNEPPTPSLRDRR